MTNNQPDQIDNEIEDILDGFENECRWDSLGVPVNQNVKFLNSYEAAAAIKLLVLKARKEELERSTGYTTTGNKATRQYVHGRIKTLEQEIRGLEDESRD